MAPGAMLWKPTPGVRLMRSHGSFGRMLRCRVSGPMLMRPCVLGALPQAPGGMLLRAVGPGSAPRGGGSGARLVRGGGDIAGFMLMRGTSGALGIMLAAGGELNGSGG